ncbi:hypothetical protein ACQKWADRAFT_145399 [Trichoderma austrokoningii]
MFYETHYAHEAKMAAHQSMPYRGPVKGSSRNQAAKQTRQSRAFDPEDLTRRLHIVLAEQKAVAERKKRARAAVEAERLANAAAAARNASVLHPGQHGIPLGPTAPSTFIQKKQVTAAASKSSHGKLESSEHAKIAKENSTSSSSNRNSEDAAPSNNNYRHVPQFAASQFARTTTAETVTEKHLLHKLSRQAMKFHMQGPNAMASMAAASDLTPSEQNKALRRVQSMRERQYERNQFQHSHTLAATAEIDEKPASPATAHTFQEYRKSKEEPPSKALRRRSVGAILGMMISSDPDPARASLSSAENQSDANHSDVVVSINADEHRVDWTQSDEAAIPAQQPVQASATSQNTLRKSESRWALRTKLGHFGKKSDKLASPTEERDEESPVESPKSPLAKAGGLFARFKR